ncbi:MAG TPA: hypothetical protein VMU19_13225 [Bryobacteraceae bacterium]|nr:hypothetical protein [Bryobacteraceae bacterium]
MRCLTPRALGVLAGALALAGAARAAETAGDALSVAGKLRFHWCQTASLSFVAETAAYAGALHAMDVPREWGQGGISYGERVASAAGATAIRNVFAFVLDSGLKEDPRYRRAGRGDVLVRAGHAARETLLTRTDAGRTRFSVWRFGSAVGAAMLSNEWYPDRLNTVPSGLEQGAATIGLDLLGNLASEFWPDVKRATARHH